MAAASDGRNFAAIDAGSHTLRLLIARLSEGGTLEPLRTERRITRLARGFQEGETLKPSSMAVSLEALREYAGLLRQHEVACVACGCTGVVRRARNQAEFLAAVERETGIRASILSEEAEAVLSARGALSVLPSPEGYVLSFDLGGGSTEFLLVHTSSPKPLFGTSVFIGAATVTERRLPGDPPHPEAVTQATLAVRDDLSPALDEILRLLRDENGASSPFLLVGTAGTVTTLAAMRLEMTSYEPFRVNGLTLDSGWLDETIDRLAASPFSARRAIPGLEAGREDIILGGAIIVREILRGLAQPRFTVTDAGLLEGLLIDRIERETGLPGGLISPLTWRLQKG